MVKMNEVAFRRMRRDLDELLLLPQRAAEFLARRAVDSLTGFAELLDEILPADPASERRVARALHLHDEVLRKLRARRIDPYSLPSPEPIVRLGRLLGLSLPAFESLLDRDHDVFAGGHFFAATRGEGSKFEALEAVRAVWERADRDDPDRVQALVEK
jgi:hypothetical protein